MKIVNVEMQKIALAAFIIGAFSLNPLARAEDPVTEDDGLIGSSRDGISLADMKNVASGFNIRIVGDTLVMDGSIPRKCAEGASFTVSSSAAEGNKPGQHEIKINLNQACLRMKPNERGAPVRLSSPALFGPSRSIADTSIDGKVCLLHAEDGPSTCDTIPNLNYTSQNTLNARALDEAAKKKRAEEAANAKRDNELRDRKEKELIEKLNLLCKNGDFASFGAEVEAAKKPPRRRNHDSHQAGCRQKGLV